MARVRMALTAALGILVFSLTLSACGDDAGEGCVSNADCGTDYCCRDNECGGMCTFTCSYDEDCPSDMACENRTCFFRCARDSDCLQAGFECKHGNTVCVLD